MKGSFADILKGLEESGRCKLDAKVPSWRGADIRVPGSINFQQSSSEATAAVKASFIPEGARVADLTGGLGVDSWAFSKRASRLLYNERDAVLLDAVRHNFAVLGLSNVVFSGFDIVPGAAAWADALREFAPDVIYLDPARRDEAGRKLFLPEECSPDAVALMPQLLELAKLQVMVKFSPMADMTMLRRRFGDCLERIAVLGSEGECKELLCICRAGAVWEGVSLWEDGLRYDPSQPAAAGSLLFVPSAAMVKSGLDAPQGAIVLDGRTGYCRCGWTEGLSRFGKFYTILEDLPLASSVFKGLGAKYPQAEITARQVPLTSEQLRKKTRTKPGGPVHIFACPVEGERRILVCQKVTAPEQPV